MYEIVQNEPLIDHEDWTGACRCPAHAYDKEDRNGEEDMVGSEHWTRKGKRTKEKKVTGNRTDEGKGKQQGQWKSHSMGNGIGTHSPGGIDMSCASVLQLQKELNMTELDLENIVWWQYTNQELSRGVKTYADDNTDSNKELNGEHSSEHDSDMDMRWMMCAHQIEHNVMVMSI